MERFRGPVTVVGEDGAEIGGTAELARTRPGGAWSGQVRGVPAPGLAGHRVVLRFASGAEVVATVVRVDAFSGPLHVRLAGDAGAVPSEQIRGGPRPG